MLRRRRARGATSWWSTRRPDSARSRARCSSTSERVLIPLQCEPLALQTTPQILRGIQAIVEPEPPASRSTASCSRCTSAGNAACERTAEYIREHVPANMVLDIVVPRTVAVADAFAAGQPVVVRDPCRPGVAGVREPRHEAGGAISQVSAITPGAVVGVVVSRGADRRCTQVGSDPQAVVALQFDSLPYPGDRRRRHAARRERRGGAASRPRRSTATGKRFRPRPSRS